ncbi:hypothetical protein PMKS-001043 [Pichia membranifaciens]|uniref:Amino-acid acetyltransferase, mitochondrial n=1 Tax=Pichia membranifaciens TaxID=4926 RepID=A0A1Q2YDH2_9ASCO|nr:hypothetical protein PMKS-001043 [Pichia membranifaciens]
MQLKILNAQKIGVCGKSFFSGRRNQSTSLLRAEDFNDESNLLKHSIASNEKHELILTILNSTATKREARSYLSKYRLLGENDIYKNRQRIVNQDQSDSHSPLVTNKQYSKYIGKLLEKDVDPLYNYNNNIEQTNPNVEAYNRGLLNSESPVLMTSPTYPKNRINEASNEIKLTQTIRACIFRIRKLHKWDLNIVKNLAVVLRKAMSLGASPVIIIDGDIIDGYKGEQVEKKLENYLDSKLESFVEGLGDLLPNRIIKGCFDLADNGELKTIVPEMIGVPIFSGIIPIVSPFAVKDGVLQVVKGFQLTRATVNCLESSEMREILSVEKVIFVDEVGGFPSVERSEGSHVLINLLQEYDNIKNELQNELELSQEERQTHLSNLNEMRQLLNRSPDITGILTTPEMAAREEEKQVGKETNPIIYNILTDRPTISSSLPVSLRRTPQLNTTVVKKGISISVYQSSDPSKGLDLRAMEKEGKVNLAKLKYLIDNSFGRDLNMDHYLNRINGKIAGLIIAGDYEGGAIITWEDLGERSVAYLDKFAVIKKLQGIPGIADVVFKAMLKSFENELLWRSRKNNPVNKWYFERSKANYSIDGTQWRLFFTGKKELTLPLLAGYIKVCSCIQPSFDIGK